MNYKNKKVLIVGLGKSGLSAARFFISRKARVSGYDKKYIKKAAAEIKNSANLIMNTGPGKVNPQNYDIIVTSPGVSPKNPILKQAGKHGVPVISELEAGYREVSGVRVIAVTGTNGKTTTCRMIENLTAGRSVVAGNIGTPLTSILNLVKKKDILVLEVSSYQIPYTPSLKPDIGVVLNIFPEHLDWHGNYDNYFRAKKKLFDRQKAGQGSVLNNQLPGLNNFIEGLESEKYFFSLDYHDKYGCYLKNNIIFWRDARGVEKIIELDTFSLKGTHNIENYMAALCASKILKIDKNKLNNFELPLHRLEEIKTKDGVTFVNDSKATNIQATVRALESYRRPVILLMGGKSKNSFHPGLITEINKKVKTLILFGASRFNLKDKFKDINPKIKVNVKQKLRPAVELAVREKEKGDTVLFSPGGSSFDEFDNYKQRGDKFKQWVEDLIP